MLYKTFKILLCINSIFMFFTIKANSQLMDEIKNKILKTNICSYIIMRI